MSINDKSYKIRCDAFVANHYDDAPSFSRWRNRNLDQCNKPYIEAAKSHGGHILELGTATGMLTIPLAREEFHVRSIDISPYMHDVVRKKLAIEPEIISKRINLIVDNAIEYSPSDLFNMIVMPDGLFDAITNQKLQIKLLENCYRHLRKGGGLYFDFAKPPLENNDFPTYFRYRDHTGNIYIITVDTSIKPYKQLRSFNFLFEKYKSVDEPILVEHIYRYVYYGELQLMLEYAGFSAINIDGDYANSRRFFVTAKKD